MVLHITEPYLWLPIDKKKSEVTLHFYCRREKFQEITMQLGGTDCDFYTTMDVSRYLGQKIEIDGEIPEEMLSPIFCCKEDVQHVYPFRPQIHFTPKIGWHNDPNGLVYADGVYHLYYQWNPYGVIWGNMHWGHAVSKDMITWEHRSMALEPDQYGTVYSGCGWQDRENVAGFGENTLLFFYTAAGGSGIRKRDFDCGDRYFESGFIYGKQHGRIGADDTCNKLWQLFALPDQYCDNAYLCNGGGISGSPLCFARFSDSRHVRADGENQEAQSESKKDPQF